jgi:hypothetical protein
MAKAHKKRIRYRITGGMINGKTELTCYEIAEFANLPPTTIYSRLNRQVFDFEKLTKPVKKGFVKLKEIKVKKPKKSIVRTKPIDDPLFRLAMRCI